MNVGKTAPGIVFEKLIQGLTSVHQIDLIAADYSPSIDLTCVNKIIIKKKNNLHPRIAKFFISYFSVNPFDCIWAWKLKRLVNKQIENNYDFVLSFLSSGNYAALIAGIYLSKKINCKLAVHSTDAIPAPIGWIEKDMFYKGLKKMIAKYLRKTDAFFSTNYQMLAYQLKTFIPKVDLITNVIYTPGFNKIKTFPSPTESINNFVYTGGIYGARKADYLLAGFEKLLGIYPDSKLLFIGNHFSTISLSSYKSSTLQQIHFLPYTRNLEPYYSQAIALIDIDAEIENDVFLSSKMPNYLMINRIIISETGNNSPARYLFKGIKSIFQCDHDPNQIFHAMKKSIELKDKITFEDRNEIIELFKLENIVEQLNNSFRKLVE